ncbi:hypothetical protein M0805_004617 [Coniferiporia weirii]|nr:hypothetical protein M0805_004617 [Coniferiporia weirii]
MANALRESLTSVLTAFSWIPYLSGRSVPTPRRVKLPDLIAALPDASSAFRINANCKEVVKASREWVKEHGISSPYSVRLPGSFSGSNATRPDQEPDGVTVNTDENEGQHAFDMKAGLLAAMCFPTADRTQLRFCADFLNWMMHLECRIAVLDRADSANLLQAIISILNNEEGLKGKEAGFGSGLVSILTRLKCSPEAPFVFDKLKDTLKDYFLSNIQKISELPERRVFSANTYISEQRKCGWPAFIFILIEYSQGLNLSSDIWRKTLYLNSVRDATADILVYAADIYARVGRKPYCTYCQGYNAVALLEHAESLDLQSAVDNVGALCIARVHEMSKLQSSILSKCSASSGSRTELKAKSDADISSYVRGLGNCVRGMLYWAFESECYFGSDAAYVRMTLSVETAGAVHGSGDQ